MARFVAFASSASNLVAGDTNNTTDVFVRDRMTGETTRVSLANDGTQANGLSTESRSSAPTAGTSRSLSTATNLTPGDTNGTADVFVHDRQTGSTTRVSVASDGTQGNGGSDSPRLSADGRYVAFSLVCLEPGGRRHERQPRRVRARPGDGRNDARERGERRVAGSANGPGSAP